MIIDAHQHFWNPARGDYGWLTPDLSIHRVYGPDDLAPLMQAAGVEASILVQAAPTVAETDYMLEIAQRTPWVLGVVGWIDLGAPDAAAQVKARAADPLFLGVRPMLQDIADPDWILQPALEPALAAIAEAGLVFDALVKGVPQWNALLEFALRHPALSIVLDHAGKPPLCTTQSMMAAWDVRIGKLAALPNVACKVSGLLTEVPPDCDDPAYHVTEAIAALCGLFGPERLLWGSDWPVLTLAGGYEGWFAMARDAIAARLPGALGAVMGANALKLYRPSRRA